MSSLPQKATGRLVSRQLPARLQADLLGRLAITLRAGIDLRKAWESEVKRMPARWQSHLSHGTRSIDNGEMLSDALAHTGLFPPLVVGMVAVGDQTGKDVETLKELSRVINHRVETLSRLRSSLILPVVQFVLALTVIGLLILISGMIELE
ncbi:MAG: type II secretion system F family protein, partial [Pirellulales bacterium]|nr:type II secretion system F family protein [Pirellulales bacterium]